jgi:hypothetical protein
MSIRWRSIWHISSALPITGAQSASKSDDIMMLPGPPKYNGQFFQTMIRLSFDTATESIEDAFVASSDFAESFVDRLSLASFARAEVLGHIATAREFSPEFHFKLLATDTLARLEYDSPWSLSTLPMLKENDIIKRSMRQFRRALGISVRSESLLMLYRALEVLAEEEAEPVEVKCEKCQHPRTVNKATKNVIRKWLSDHQCEPAIAKEFVAVIRNKVAHGSSGHTLLDDEKYITIFHGVAPIVAAILRERSGVPTICSESMVVKRPYVIHECMWVPSSNEITGQCPHFQCQGAIMRVGADWGNAPIKTCIKYGLEGVQLSIDGLAYVLPWIVPNFPVSPGGGTLDPGAPPG